MMSTTPRANRLQYFPMKTSLGLAVASLSLPTVAQSPDQNTDSEGTVNLGAITVSGKQASDYQPERMSSSKYTEPLRDIPQSISVIPKKVLEEQNAQSLEDILRNVPGITFNSGEGNGGLGDSLNIRGFKSDGNIYRDGVRDVGKYTRSEIFNIEQVEVVKGSTSSTWGVGSVGGAVNLVTKTPQAQDFTNVGVGFGTADYKRATLDVNRVIDGMNLRDGATAVRLNIVGHESGIDGRDWIHRERNGFAPSISFGLGSDTRIKLAYEYLNDYGNVNFGIPADQTRGKPSHVGHWDGYWGFRNLDKENNKTHRFTGRFEHDINSVVSFDTQFSWGKVDREYSVTTPHAGPNQMAGAGSLRRLVGVSRNSTNDIYGNQTNLTFNFFTGPIHHTLVTGLEYSKEHLDLKGGSLVKSASLPPTDPSNPPSVYPGDTSRYTNNHLKVESEVKSYYALNTMKFNEHWQMNLGVRRDHYEARDKKNVDYTSEGSATVKPLYRDADKLTSYNAAVIYKPVRNGSFYVSFSNARSPMSVTSVSQFGVGNTNFSSKGKNYEVGTKWDLMDERLSLTAAIFQTERNTTFTDTVTNEVLASDGEERVRGVELGAAGNITDKWSVYAGYAYQHSEITKGSAGGVQAEEGIETQNTPKHSFNLWTTYQLPYGFDVSYGARYMGEVYINDGRGTSTNRNARIQVPDYWVHEAALGYRVNENVKLRLNVHNLFNKHYWNQYNGRWFGQPGEGRGAQLTADISF